MERTKGLMDILFLPSGREGNTPLRQRPTAATDRGKRLAGIAHSADFKPVETREALAKLGGAVRTC